MRTASLISKPLAAGIATALLLSSTAAGAFAAELQSEPIHVDHVQVTYESLSVDDASRAPLATEISFTNEYSAPATNVVFLLEQKGSVVDRFDDVGTFAPGVLVRHSFPENQPGGDFSVVVAAATFADGTKWQNSGVGDQPASAPIVGGTPADEY
jgi:hypothetical protein